MEDKYIKISGLQKLTLLDYPEHTACTLFVPGCNFRCPFCHNSELLTGGAEYYDESEIFDFLKKRRGVLEGVCITGGEPTLYSDLDRFLTDVKSLGYAIKLDTNGYRPDRIEELYAKQLVDYVAMDIKNSPERYSETAGLDERMFDITRIKDSVALIMGSGVPYEFRTTISVELFDANSVAGAAALVKGADKYFLQKFVMRDTVPSKTLTAPTDALMHEYLDIALMYVPTSRIRGE